MIRDENYAVIKSVIDEIWYNDSRNTEDFILTDHYNGFRLVLKKHKKGYKFYIAVRRYKVHGIGDNLTKEAPVAFFKDCNLFMAKVYALSHFDFMISE